MLALTETRRIVHDAVAAVLGDDLVRVVTEEGVGPFGDTVLNIQVVLGDRPEEIAGDALVEVLGQTYDRLQEWGDQRFPILSFTTEAEQRRTLAEADDAPSV